MASEHFTLLHKRHREVARSRLTRISQAIPSRAEQESVKYESAQFLSGDAVLKQIEVQKNDQTRSLSAIGSRSKNTLEKCGRDQSGLSFLIVMIVLPFLLACSLAGLELVRAQLIRTALQADTDRIALLAVARLPQEELAKAIVELEINKLNSSANSSRQVDSPQNPLSISKLQITNRRVLDLSLQTSFGSDIARVLGIPFNFTISASAIAQIAPLDLALIVADDRSLRPGLVASLPQLKPAEPWGETIALDYFAIHSPPSYPTLPASPGQPQDWMWWKDWRDGGGGTYPPWATQACYNESFSAVKLAAISLVDLILSSDDNRLGFIYSPGDGAISRLSVLRSVGSTNLAGIPGGYLSEKNIDQSALSGNSSCFTQAATYTFSENADYPGNYGVSHDSCLAFTQDDRFRLPNAPTFLQVSSRPPQSLCSTPSDIFASAGNKLNSCCLTLRDAIYWHSAHLQSDIALEAAIPEAQRQLTVASKSSVEDLLRRDNLAAVTTKRIGIITSYLPPFEDLRTTLDQAQSADISIVIAVFAHRYLTSQSLTLLEERFRDYAANATSASGPGVASKTLKIFITRDATNLSQRVVEQVFSTDRMISLKR